MIENISKPAFNPTSPSTNLKGFNMLDVGANKICDEYDWRTKIIIYDNVYRE